MSRCMYLKRKISLLVPEKKENMEIKSFGLLINQQPNNILNLKTYTHTYTHTHTPPPFTIVVVVVVVVAAIVPEKKKHGKKTHILIKK